jgi:ribosomal protein S12 methylthiotransferase
MSRFSLINLGCPKNTVDSECMLGSLAQAGLEFTPEPLDADICLVNTCGFLDAARQEAAEVFAELVAQREGQGRERPLLVALGCLVERAVGAKELADFLSAADARVGFADYPRLPDICRNLLAGGSHSTPTSGYAGQTLPKTYLDWLSRPRLRIGSLASAYVKISEGCSHCCSYCSIPLIRGRRVSRPLKAVMKEIRELVLAGAVELNVIAQDTAAYGLDWGGEPQLPRLLRELRRIPGDLWFRLLYMHPRNLTADILEEMAADERICPYLDLPLQHVSDGLLKRMGRGHGRKRIEELLQQVEKFLPDAALRTAFIVGHPGEKEADFAELLEFVEAGHFDHVGVFCWSPEPGTVSAGMADRVAPEVAEERQDQLMRAQAAVSARRLKGRKGAARMLVERQEPRGWVGRTAWQAPEVDGETIVTGVKGRCEIGRFLPVKIVRTGTYDCEARRMKT